MQSGRWATVVPLPMAMMCLKSATGGFLPTITQTPVTEQQGRKVSGEGRLEVGADPAAKSLPFPDTPITSPIADRKKKAYVRLRRSLRLNAQQRSRVERTNLERLTGMAM